MRKPGGATGSEETIDDSGAIDGCSAIVAQNIVFPFNQAGVRGACDGHQSASSETPALLLHPIRAVPVGVMERNNLFTGLRATTTFNFDDKKFPSQTQTLFHLAAWLWLCAPLDVAAIKGIRASVRSS